MEEEEDHYEAGSLYVVKIEPYLSNQKTSAELTQNDPNKTVDFFKSKLEYLLKVDFRIQKKLKQLHRLQYQLSLLINKSIEGIFGLPENIVVPKSFIQPLPPIEKGTLSELLRVLHSSSPTDLQNYIYKSGIVEQLVFGDSSNFNSRLLECLVHSPPDIQISFTVSIIEQIRVCSEFYYKLLSMISQFILEGSLRNQLISPNSNLSKFYDFYEKFLKQIAEICKADECKIIYYSDDNQKLLFPTKNIMSIISTDDSLSGVLIRQLKTTQIEYPRREKSFEAITEGSLFSEDNPILSIPIRVGQNPSSGLLILFRHSSKFTITDELISSKVTEFLSPILQLIRLVFVQINPNQYTQLFQCISSLRSSESQLFDLIKEQFCKITSSTFCKLYVEGYASIDYPELPQLPQEQSLVRKSLESESVMMIKNPRSHLEFNKEVDDESSLTKISSMLIFKVKNLPIMIVLYNSKISSEFSDRQQNLAISLSLSLCPLLLRHSTRNRIDRSGSQCDENQLSLMNLFECLKNSIQSLGKSDKFRESVKKAMPRCVDEFEIYWFIGDDKAIKLTDGEVSIVPQKICEITEKVVYKKSENSDIFDVYKNDVKCLYVIPIKNSEYRAVFTFSSIDDENAFNDSTVTDYCDKASSLLHLLLPSYVYNFALNEIRERSYLISSSSQLSVDSISHFVGSKVEYHFFNPPVSQEPRLNKPLSIMVETPNGIEAALTSESPVKNENAKKAFVSFAEMMSSVLTAKKCQQKEPPAVCASFFVDSGVLNVFGCTIFRFNEWLAAVFSIYENACIDPLKKFNMAKFVKEMIVVEKWENWFTKEEKIVIILITFLSEIKKCWRCKVDDQIASVFNELRCRPITGLFCSILLGNGFGITGKSSSLSDKKLLIGLIDNFAVDDSAHDIAEITSHVRLISLKGFKQSSSSKMWIGRALVLISNLQEFAEFEEAKIGQIASEMNETDKKKIIFRIEKVFIPMISCIAQKNEPVTQILENLRLALKILHES